MKRDGHPLFNLTGRVALVTGGCQNFGWEIATGLAEAGADLVITSREADKATAAAAKLAAAHGVQVEGVPMDLFDEASVRRAFARAAERFGRLDILVNNAGGHSNATGQLETEPVEGFERFLKANVTGTFLCIREAAPLMMRQNSGSIINIASVTSLLGRDRSVYAGTPMKNPVAYTASKAGAIGLTYDSAAYLGAWGIRVNAIAPGGFERGQPDSFVQAYNARTMLGRMGRDGHDLKGAVIFLASEAAAYVTGHVLYVDGGFSRFK
jgi:NAD(P)-dependent dehydrogenase (short-subunit alcohol dehydrogenase family)